MFLNQKLQDEEQSDLILLRLSNIIKLHLLKMNMNDLLGNFLIYVEN